MLISKYQREQIIKRLRTRANYHSDKEKILEMIDLWLVPELESTDNEWILCEEAVGRYFFIQ